MKKFFFFISLTAVINGFVFSQVNNMTLTFKAYDYFTNLPLVTDSVLIVNITKDCDTVLYGQDELYLEWTDGIDESFFKQSFAIGMKQANPFNGNTAFMLFTRGESPVTVMLFNETGVKLYEGEYTLGAGLHSFNLSTANPGIYFLVASNGTLVRSLKLVNSTPVTDAYDITYQGVNVENFHLKSVNDDNGFEFTAGDTLEFTIYSFGYESETIIDTPAEDKEYGFQLKPDLIDFTADTTSGYAPLNVSFSGITNMNIQSWHWDFGDGTTSNLQNPSHIYDEQDKYFTVTLTVVDGSNITHHVTKENFIHVFHDLASVNFTADVTEGFSPMTVHFTGYANFQANYWQWSFGDGQTANVQNPTIEFLYPGVYSVTLEVFSNNGSVSTTKEDYIHVGSCPPLMQDNDGNTYETVLIGNQCWMKSNINVGIKIDKDEQGSNNGIIEKYCYNNDDDDCDEYGGLYDYNETMQYGFVEKGQGLCPAGWHIPSENEYSQLVNFLGGEVVAGGKLKEEGFEHWKEPNTGSTNSSGFTALGAGYLWADLITSPVFSERKERLNLWTSTGWTSNSNLILELWYADNAATVKVKYSTSGCSVRCVKDVE